jgi:hypothetical protein
MTASVTTSWTEAPHSGLDTLSAVLSDPTARNTRALWNVLHQAYPAAAKALSQPNGAMLASMHPRDDLDTSTLEKLRITRPWIAADLLEDLHRALVNSPRTLTALSAGAANPVHGSERPSLTAAVARRLLLVGCEPREVAVRRLTYAAVDAIAGALSALDA